MVLELPSAPRWGRNGVRTGEKTATIVVVVVWCVCYLWLCRKERQSKLERPGEREAGEARENQYVDTGLEVCVRGECGLVWDCVCSLVCVRRGKSYLGEKCVVVPGTGMAEND